MCRMMPIMLLDLDDDVIGYTFGYFGLGERNVLRLVCKRFQNIMDTTKALQPTSIKLYDDYENAAFDKSDKISSNWSVCKDPTLYLALGIRCSSIQSITCVPALHCRVSPYCDSKMSAIHTFAGNQTERHLQTVQNVFQMFSHLSSVTKITNFKLCWLSMLTIPVGMSRSLQHLELECNCGEGLPPHMFLSLQNVRELRLVDVTLVKCDAFFLF